MNQGAILDVKVYIRIWHEEQNQTLMIVLAMREIRKFQPLVFALPNDQN